MSYLGHAARARPAGAAGGGEAGRAATRLRRLARGASTGMLPFAGHCEGAVYLAQGRVVRAESAAVPAARARRPGDLTAPLLDAEPTVDAALELLASPSGCGRFRAGITPPAGPECSISVGVLLAEVSRRRHVLAQLAGVLTPDTAVVRSRRLSVPGAAVSALQWALVIRVRGRATPRTLAWELGLSVFAATTEAYRLVALGLLDVPSPARPAAGPPAPSPLAMSFVRAVP